MKCPVCKSNLKTQNINEYEILLCQENHGSCIDGDDLGNILRLLASQPDTPYAKIKDVFHLSGPVHAVDEKRNCPSCDLKMTTFNYAYNSNIFLDRCSDCGKVWIDAEEFPKLLSYVKGNPKVDSLAEAVSEYEKENIAEQNSINDLACSSNYIGYGILDYIERKLYSKRTPALTKIFWATIIIIILSLMAYIEYLNHQH